MIFILFGFFFALPGEWKSFTSFYNLSLPSEPKSKFLAEAHQASCDLGRRSFSFLASFICTLILKEFVLNLFQFLRGTIFFNFSARIWRLLVCTPHCSSPQPSACHLANPPSFGHDSAISYLFLEAFGLVQPLKSGFDAFLIYLHSILYKPLSSNCLFTFLFSTQIMNYLKAAPESPFPFHSPFLAWGLIFYRIQGINE